MYVQNNYGSLHNKHFPSSIKKNLAISFYFQLNKNFRKYVLVQFILLDKKKPLKNPTELVKETQGLPFYDVNKTHTCMSTEKLEHQNEKGKKTMVKNKAV